MTLANTKYGVKVDSDTLNTYHSRLLNDCFKLLGIYEGKDPNTKQVICTEEEAHRHYLKYLDNLCVELWGAYKVFHENVLFLKLANTLEGMQRIKQGEHNKLKSLVFNCISICEKMKGRG